MQESASVPEILTVTQVVSGKPALSSDAGLPQAWGTPRKEPEISMGDSERSEAYVKAASAQIIKDGEKEEPKPGLYGAVRKLREVEYDVIPKKFKDNFPKYKTHGLIARIGRSNKFEYSTLSVIGLNAIWIGIDTDRNKKDSIVDADIQFKIMENFFCWYFSAEVIIRFICFHTKKLCLTDGWFVFDSILVSMMVFETWMMPFLMSSGGGAGSLSILRLLRLLRLTRMARLMRAVPEVLILVKGMVAATRSVMSTLILLVIAVYVFAIVFKTQLGEDPDYEDFFGGISTAMFHLLLQGTLLDDISGLMRPMVERKMWVNIFLMMIFILISAFTVINMLIGVLCEVVSETQVGEREKATVSLVQEQIEGVLEEIDQDGGGTISKKEFDQIKDNEVVKAALEEIGVETKHLLALSDTLFDMDDDEVQEELIRLHRLKQEQIEAGVIPPEDDNKSEASGSSHSSQKRRELMNAEEIQKEGKELTFQEFLQTVCHMRPENDCSVMDIADVRKMMRSSLRKTEKAIDDLGQGILNLDKDGVPEKHMDALWRLLGCAKDMRAKVQDERARTLRAETLAAELQAQLDKLQNG